MVTAKESKACQQFATWNSPQLDHMALLKPDSSPYFPPQKSTQTSRVGFTSDLHGLSTGQDNAVGGFFKPPRQQWNIPSPTGGPYLKFSQFALRHGHGFFDKQIDGSSAPQKKFLIFDQSGNDTRLFFSTSFSPDNQNIASKIPASANEQFLVNEEKWDENHLSDGEGEMLEDSEEINALLYSDSDDEYYNDDDDDDDDEVTSTRHNEFIIEEGNDKDKFLEERLEEVANFDGLPKRQRLVDGRYKKSSLVGLGSPVNRANSSTSSNDDDIDSTKREKKVKIREALKILENIIPGVKSKDPLSIIEKAIVYLESMKTEAEALGLSHPEDKPGIFP